MKKFFAATALLAITAAGAASAASQSALVEIQRYAPNADVSTLTDAQVGALTSVIKSGDSRSEISGTVQSLIDTYQR